MALTKVVGELIDIGDLDISNVGSIQLDSIAGDADSNTSITFSGSDVITIATGGSGRLTIGDGALSPVTDNQIDLGTSSLEFKDAYFDGTVTSDAFAGPLTGDVTGNVSGTAATVTGAAQTNITSLGTLTTLTVDDITLNNSTISDNTLLTISSGDDIVLDATSDIILDADGGDIRLKDAGTAKHTISMQSNGDTYFVNETADTDIYFRGVDGSSTITALTLDMSAAGAATFNSYVATTAIASPDGTQLIYPTNSANVGIGTASPSSKLHINSGSDNEVIRLESTDTEAYIHLKDSTGSSYIKGRADLRFEVGGNDVVQMLSGETVINNGSNDHDFRVESNGNANMLFVDGGNDKVGIGTASPASLLHIESSTAWGAQLMINQDDAGTTGAQLFLKHTSSSPADDDYVGFISFKGENGADEEVQYARIYATTADVTDGVEDGSLFFDTAVAGTQNTNVMSIVGGKVQIGGATTDGVLAVKGTGAYVDADSAANNNAGMRLYEGGTFKWQLYNDGDASDNYTIDSAAGTKISVTQGGNVGIGETSPDHDLHIKSGSNYTTLNIESASTTHGSEILMGDSTDADYGSIMQFASSAGEGGRMRFIAGTTETMNLRGGNVGIGTGTPSELLHIKGSNAAQKIRVERREVDGIMADNDEIGALEFWTNEDTYASGAAALRAKIMAEVQDTSVGTNLQFWTGATGGASAERMRIIADGKVGIGDDAPAYMLDINASSTASAFRIASGGNGKDVNCTISNGGTSATDDTLFDLTTADGAGDPKFRWSVSGQENYEMGIDNSDADKLKISQGTALGTTDRMTFGGGAITLAQGGSGADTHTKWSNGQVSIADDALVDIDSCINTAALVIVSCRYDGASVKYVSGLYFVDYQSANAPVLLADPDSAFSNGDVDGKNCLFMNGNANIRFKNRSGVTNPTAIHVLQFQGN